MANPDGIDPHRSLIIAVEALGNILYLIQNSADRPDAVHTLLKMTDGPMETLRTLASRRLGDGQAEEHPPQRRRLLADEQEADHADRPPLAAAGEGDHPSPDGASPGSQIEEPEDD